MNAEDSATDDAEPPTTALDAAPSRGPAMTATDSALGAATKEQPCDIDAERSVLATVLLYGVDALSIVEETVGPADYYSPVHAMIHLAARRARERGAIDGVTVAHALAIAGELDGAPDDDDADDAPGVGGRETVYGLLPYAVMPSCVHSHARIVRELAVRRRTVAAAHALAAGALDVTVERDETIALARATIDEIEGVRAPETVASVLERWGRDGPLERAATGIPTLDAMLRGGLPFGSLAIVLGSPDAGKTLLIVALADTFADAGYVVGVLAVDEDSDGLATRLLQRRNWSRDDVDARGRLDEMADACDATLARIRFYDESRSIESAAQDLAQFARRHHARPVLLVDSLQTIRSEGEKPRDDLRTAVTGRVRVLKEIAARNGMLAVATSEIVRAAYRGGPEPAVADLAAGKESGAIEYQAKVLLAMRSVRGEPGLLALRVVKNKAGAVIHDPADPGDAIYLRIHRDVQTLIQDPDLEAPARTDRRAAKQERARDEQMDDAAIVAAVLAAEPGLTTRRLRVATRKRAGAFSHARLDVALAILGAAVRVVRQRQAHRHYLDGADVGDLVLARLAEGERVRVRAATAPEDALPLADLDSAEDATDAEI